MEDYERHMLRYNRLKMLWRKLGAMSFSFDRLADDAFDRFILTNDRCDMAYYRLLSENANRYLDLMERVQRWMNDAWNRAYDAKQEAKRKNGGRVLTGE